MTEPAPHIQVLVFEGCPHAEAAMKLARAALSPDVKVWSAGSRPTSVRPEAVTVLKELGIDISGHRSKAGTAAKDQGERR